jgi:hypothetical protein
MLMSFHLSSRCFDNVWASCVRYQDSVLKDVKAMPKYWTPEYSSVWYWIGPSTHDSLLSLLPLLCHALASISTTSKVPTLDLNNIIIQPQSSFCFDWIYW